MDHALGSDTGGRSCGAAARASRPRHCTYTSSSDNVSTSAPQGTDPPSLARALEHIIEPDHLASLHRALADATPSLRDADKPAVREVLRALRGMRGYAICGGLRSAQETGWEEAVERWCA